MASGRVGLTEQKALLLYFPEVNGQSVSTQSAAGIVITEHHAEYPAEYPLIDSH